LRAQLRRVYERHDLLRKRRSISSRHDHRVAAVGEHVHQSVRIRGDDRLAHRQRFEHGERGSLPE
jgi:hypothetical protein